MNYQIILELPNTTSVTDCSTNLSWVAPGSNPLRLAHPIRNQMGGLAAEGIRAKIGYDENYFGCN